MAVGNVFYDMSDKNITITAAQPGFDFSVPPPANVTCGDPGPTTVTLGTVSILVIRHQLHFLLLVIHQALLSHFHRQLLYQVTM
jgi:hypothetical protein